MTKRISRHIQNQPQTNLQRQGLLLQLLFISALNQILVSISCLLYAFVKRWDKELWVCSTTSSVGSGWGSHPVAFGVWYATNLESWIKAGGIFFPFKNGVTFTERAVILLQGSIMEQHAERIWKGRRNTQVVERVLYQHTFVFMQRPRIPHLGHRPDDNSESLLIS